MAVRKFGFLTIALTIGSPAMVVAEPAAKAANADDPERIVCKKLQVSGSRLGGQKVCMSHAQWEIQRQADREAIQRTQNTRYKSN